MSLQDATPHAYKPHAIILPPAGPSAQEIAALNVLDNLAIVMGLIRRAERAALTAVLAAPRGDRRNALRDLAAAMHTPTAPLRGRLLALATPAQRAALTPDL